MELIQKKLFSRQEFRFDDTALFVNTKNLITGTKQWSVKLDEIGFRQDVRQMGIFTNGCLFSTFVIILSTLIIIHLAFLTALVVLILAMTPMMLGRLINRFNYIQLHTKRGPLAIGYGRSEKQKADEFIMSLKEASKKYMLWKYATLDEDINPEKQIENFWWLRNNEIITDEEYIQLKSKLKSTFQNKG